MSEELKPCPFCGNDELTAEPETTYVMCHGCDADGPMTKPGEAIKVWNTRAAPPQPDHSAQPVAIVCGSSVQWLPGAGSLKDRAELHEKPQPLDTVQGDAQAVYMARSHGSCCWEEISGESLEVCEFQPEEYEVRKFYTHADSGEVERLKLMLEEETDRVQIAIKMQQKAITGRDAALARLATAEQLLVRAERVTPPTLCGEIFEYLSASPKPEGGEA